MTKEIYEAPEVIELGDAAELILGCGGEQCDTDYTDYGDEGDV